LKKFILIIFIAALSAVSSYAQVAPVLIKMDTVLTNTAGTKTFYLKNLTSKVMHINNVRSVTSKFYFTVSSFSINPNDSVQVTVYFKTNQNITYKDFLIFETTGGHFPLVNYSLATAKYPESYYSFSQGLFDEALKTAIRTYTTTGYISLGYNTARDKMFETVDDYNNDDTIECVYIGRKIKAATRTEAQNQNFNTEHTLPQSNFNEAEPMRSDLFHLYPTDNTPNNYRSNYNFGHVVANITYENNGSKLGKDSTGATVFEPRDVHKGNVARSLFYFVTKYGNSNNYLTLKEENTLRWWNYLDTVNARERTRNVRIKSFQNVFNPFIDHPELAERITSFYTTGNAAPKGKISAAPWNVVYDTTRSGDTSSYYVAIMNYGNATLTVSSVTSNSTAFVVESSPASIAAGELAYAKVKFKPTSPFTLYSGTLTIANSDLVKTVTLTGVSGQTLGIEQLGSTVPSSYSLNQNYPNPFNPETNIEFSLPKSSFVNLSVFDISGKLVSTLVESSLSAGKYNYRFTSEGLSSGVYFYKLVAGDFMDVKRLMIVK